MLAAGDLFDDLLRWATLEGASDIKLTPTDPVSISKDGRFYHVTDRPASSGEIYALIDRLSNDKGASSKLHGGFKLNFAYEITAKAGDRRSGSMRFRCNATSVSTHGGGAAASLTLRTIPTVIRRFEDSGVPDELGEHLFPDHGLIIISGVMGSGKTTLLASIIQYVRLNFDKAIQTIESPIEFDYKAIEGARGTIEQMEVVTMIPSFAEGVVSATRKGVNLLLVGESNDRETMEATVTAAEVGIAVMTTLHTSSVSAIPSRIVHQFSADEAPGIGVSLLSASRVYIQQRLVPKKGGGRVPLREWVVFNEDHRNRLINVPFDQLQHAVEDIVQTDGHSLLRDAQEKHAAGLIEDSVLRSVMAEKERLNAVLQGKI
jgi:defect-in-organelle-trafficking protein DotB